MQNINMQQDQQSSLKPKNKNNTLINFSLWMITTIIIAIAVPGPFFNISVVAMMGFKGLIYALVGTLALLIGRGAPSFIISFIICLIVKKWRNMESTFLIAWAINMLLFFSMFGL